MDKINRKKSTSDIKIDSKNFIHKYIINILKKWYCWKPGKSMQNHVLKCICYIRIVRVKCSQIGSF